jgi:glycogen operon protein
MAVILFLSQGVPMLVAGDEFRRSQQGNNNAWCQDNPISWIDWELATKNRGQLRFFRKLIHLRKSHPIFKRSDFFEVHEGIAEPATIPEIIWQGLHPGEQDWSSACRTLAFLLYGATLGELEDDDFFVMLNGSPSTSALFTAPAPSRNRIWVRIIDTGRLSPADFIDQALADKVECGSTISVSSMGCVVLQSVPMR